MVRLAMLLKIKFDAVHDAAELTRAAAEIGNLEGSAAEFAESIEFHSDFTKELNRLSDDSSIHPGAVAAVYVLNGLRCVGEDVPDYRFEEFLQAVNSWSTFEIRNAVATIRRNYPTIYSVSDNINDNIINLGHGGQRSVSGSHNASSCYIASAVYGPNAQETDAFRRWRDHVLVRSFCGRVFVRFYYAVSPALARWVSGRKWAVDCSKVVLQLVAKLAGVSLVDSAIVSDK
jgi:hypothetical protein